MLRITMLAHCLVFKINYLLRIKVFLIYQPKI